MTFQTCKQHPPRLADITRRNMLAMIPRFAAIFALPLLAVTASAEVPPMSDDQLENMANLIATGYITDIVVRNEVSHRPEKIVTSHYTVTMTTDLLQKGTLPAGTHQIQFTGYRNVVVPKHWVGGSNTLRLDLHKGDHIKVYLQQFNNEWALFHYMGIKRVSEQ